MDTAESCRYIRVEVSRKPTMPSHAHLRWNGCETCQDLDYSTLDLTSYSDAWRCRNNVGRSIPWPDSISWRLPSPWAVDKKLYVGVAWLLKRYDICISKRSSRLSSAPRVVANFDFTPTFDTPHLRQHYTIHLSCSPLTFHLSQPIALLHHV